MEQLKILEIKYIDIEIKATKKEFDAGISPIKKSLVVKTNIPIGYTPMSTEITIFYVEGLIPKKLSSLIMIGYDMTEGYLYLRSYEELDKEKQDLKVYYIN